ncbi:MAG: hypothetical protein ABIT58_06080 [Ferruginibacter sp.]
MRTKHDTLIRGEADFRKLNADPDIYKQHHADFHDITASKNGVVYIYRNDERQKFEGSEYSGQ